MFSGFIFSDAQRFVPCPRCHVAPQFSCITPRGRKTWPPHKDRTAALAKQYPKAIAAATRRRRTRII